MATGESLRRRILEDGFEHRQLQLTAGSIPDLMRLDDLPDSQRALIEATLEASRGGMVHMLRFQADNRLSDLLHAPREVYEQIRELISELRPRAIICVQLSYNATLALLAMGVSFASFCTGHPAQLPADGELYGYPHVRPSEFQANRDELRELAIVCKTTQDTFTRRFNELGRQFSPNYRPVINGLSASSPELILHHYVDSLISYRRKALPRQARMLGSTIREEAIDGESSMWLEGAAHDRPRVFCSLGSFFSLRDDVLKRIIDAIATSGFQAVIASGVFDTGRLTLPSDWYVRAWLPQSAMLQYCDLAICHGGNNTVMESLTRGVPLVIAPFSSDQFASAADIERYNMGTVIDPNTSSVPDIQNAMDRALREVERVSKLGSKLRAEPGAAKAWSLMKQMPSR